MSRGASPGTYALGLPTARAGPVHLALRLGPAHSFTAWRGVAGSYDRTLRAGRTLHVLASAPSSDAHDPARIPLFVGGSGALAIVGAACLVLAVRGRRLPMA